MSFPRVVPTLCRALPSPGSFVSDPENPAGLHTVFYSLASGSLAAAPCFAPIHQSYPGRAHGGLITALLDEAAGQTIRMLDPELNGVTGELKVRFLTPVPIDASLLLEGKVITPGKHLIQSEVRLYLPDGMLAARGVFRYVPLSYSAITGMEKAPTAWTVLTEKDPAEFSLPEWKPLRDL